MMDMHCHLDLYPDPFEVAKQCDEKGLYVLSVTTTPKAWDGTNRLATGYKRIQTALGLHPQLAHQRANELEGINGIPVLHWFTGTKSELKRALSMGCWFSVGPAMLGTKRGKELVSNISKNRILLETDGPFAKSKGKSLMPWDTDMAIESIAYLWGVQSQEVERALLSNLRELTK